jgi:hypothetical protein
MVDFLVERKNAGVVIPDFSKLYNDEKTWDNACFIFHS